MKKIILSVSVLLVYMLYSIHQRSEAANVQVIVPKQPQNPSPTSASAGIYRDGQYTGDVTDAFYGNLQVKAIIQNGKITDVQFLQYPNDRGESIEINTQAMPSLTQEAIQSQHAQVDIVSGATQTSEAFRQSLQSALDKAKI